jgi:hypothetical protein
VKLVNSATSMRVPARRCSAMPMDEASIAQAAKPWSTKPRRPPCSSTGSGVVRPVEPTARRRAPGRASRRLADAQRADDAAAPAQRVSACAVHQAVEVLPLVPVTATTSSARAGLP